MKKSEVKLGAFLSYVLIFLNSVYGLVITPYILSKIGSSEYGVYKTIASLSGSLAVLDFGMGSTVLRYIAKFKAEDDNERINNYLGMVLIQISILVVGVCIVGLCLYGKIDTFYANTFSSSQIITAKQLFLLLIVNVCFTFFENVFFGIISGNNKFGFANSIKILMLLLRSVLTIVLVGMFRTALVVVLVQLMTTITVMIIHILYIRNKLNVKYILNKWDKALFFDSFKYTVLMFLQSIVIQFNGNVDNLVIGAVIGAEAVTVYSFSIIIYNMYEQFSTAISSVMLPTVTIAIHEGASNREMEDLVIKIGKIQFYILGLFLTGFIILGKDFFVLWLGEGFSDCYILALILMIPVTVPLIQNVCISILRARNLMKFRTLSLVYSTVINCILTVIGTVKYGYFAAAIGTACSTVIGSIISMNIYYKIKLGLNPIRMLFLIIYKVIPAIFISVILMHVIRYSIGLNICHNWIQFIIMCSICAVIYLGILVFINGKEIKNELHRIKEKK